MEIDTRWIPAALERPLVSLPSKGIQPTQKITQWCPSCLYFSLYTAYPSNLLSQLPPGLSNPSTVTHTTPPSTTRQQPCLTNLYWTLGVLYCWQLWSKYRLCPFVPPLICSVYSESGGSITFPAPASSLTRILTKEGLPCNIVTSQQKSTIGIMCSLENLS